MCILLFKLMLSLFMALATRSFIGFYDVSIVYHRISHTSTFDASLKSRWFLFELSHTRTLFVTPTRSA